MSNGAIKAQIYQVEVLKATISNITDQIIFQLNDWQSRTLDRVYPLVWLDAIHYKIKEDERYLTKALYTLLALNTSGRKELIDLYCS